MKYIECKLPVEVKIGEAEWVEQYLPARLVYSEANEAYAKANAENGEYSIVEYEPEPTADDVLNALLGVTE